MAKYLNEQKIIESNILQQLQNSYSHQSKRLQGTPIFVTYYNRNVKASTEDKTLENVKDIIGYESPVLFNKVENFPLYLVGEVSPNIEFDESFGMNTTGEGDAVILPNTITPYINDLFKINYLDNDYLFEVTNLEADKVNGAKFYKINYRLSTFKEEQAEESIAEEFETEYDNIGTHENPIIEKSRYILADRINKYLSYIREFYLNSFMYKKYNILLYQFNDKIIYNEFLIRFIINNKILENTEKKLLSSYYIQDIFTDSPAFYELYNQTIYKAIEMLDYKYFRLEDMVTMRIPKSLKNNPFSMDREDYYRVSYVESNLHDKNIKALDEKYNYYAENHEINLTYEQVFDLTGNNSSYTFEFEDPKGLIKHVWISPHDSRFIEKCNNMIFYKDNDTFFLENIIINYLNHTLDINNDFLTLLENHHYFPFLREFLLLPIIMLILKREVIKLTNNI